MVVTASVRSADPASPLLSLGSLTLRAVLVYSVPPFVLGPCRHYVPWLADALMVELQMAATRGRALSAAAASALPAATQRVFREHFAAEVGLYEFAAELHAQQVQAVREAASSGATATAGRR